MTMKYLVEAYEPNLISLTRNRSEFCFFGFLKLKGKSLLTYTIAKVLQYKPGKYVTISGEAIRK